MRISNSAGSWKAISFLAAAFSLFIMVGCSDAPTVETVSALSRDGGLFIEATGKIISDGGEDVLSKGFCMSTHPNPSITDNKKPVKDMPDLYSANLTGLDKNVIYYVRAYAENSVGVGYGEVIEVITSAAPLVQTGPAEVLGNSEAVLRGSVDALNSKTDKWFEVWTNNESPRRFYVESADVQSAAEVFVTASNLTPGEVYSYVFKASNEAGTVSGEVKTFRLYYEQVSDYDGNKYWTVKIRAQIWLESNLKTTHFLNGDPILNVQPDAEWVAMKSPAWCYTKNDPELGKVYGCLYNNYVGLDSRGLIAGYHTPSRQEYKTLAVYLGGEDVSGLKMRSNTSDWHEGGKGNNVSGFNALPGGARGDENNQFQSLSYQSSFLTSTPMEGVGAYYDVDIYHGVDFIVTSGARLMHKGRSIRLIKN